MSNFDAREGLGDSDHVGILVGSCAGGSGIESTYLSRLLSLRLVQFAKINNTCLLDEGGPFEATNGSSCR